MKFEIKHRVSGSALFSVETKSLKLCVEAAVKSGADLRGAYLAGAYLTGADLAGADLRVAYLAGAYLTGADLAGADLRVADLRGADLTGAYLAGADLRGADLRGAYLRGADLRGARGANKMLCTPLMILLDQPEKIRAYKLVTSKGVGPYNGGITYEMNGEYSVDNADCTDEQCAAGINLATLDWCMREWREGYRILVAEFQSKDIASIPMATDGKFRVHRCKIVAEKDLKEIGLVKE
jgi:uncharacterized protein YjbI with pentapeptide repeats